MKDLGQGIEWLSIHQPTTLAVIRVLLMIVPVLVIVPGLIWYERRLLSWMQDRIGPNRTGTITLKNGKKIRTFGLLQPIADGVKLFFKEDITPAAVDRFLYFLSPAIALFPAFAIGGTLPWGPGHGIYGLLTPVWGSEIGLLYLLAISSLGVYGVVLSGYASNNKYSLMGGLRGAAQLISYELAMAMSLASIILVSGSLKLTEVVSAQEGPLWGVVYGVQNWFIFTPFGFVSAVIFLICMVAETNRVPFDLPEAENELIAGYHTEYSSMKFAVYFMGEYAMMFIFGGVFGVVFLGGYNIVPIRWDALAGSMPGYGAMHFIRDANYWLAPLTFLAKCAAGITFYIWLRATLPRLRYDQLMALGWKFLLPAAVANFIVSAAWIMAQKLWGWPGALGASVAAIMITAGLYSAVKRAMNAGTTAMEKRTLALVEGTETVPSVRAVELV